MLERTYQVVEGVDAMDTARDKARRAPVSARVLVALHKGHCTVKALSAALGASRASVDSALRGLMQDGVVEMAPVEELWSDIPDVVIREPHNKRRGAGGN